MSNKHQKSKPKINNSKRENVSLSPVVTISRQQIKKDDIDTVQGYIQSISIYIPSDVIDLILFFYAKPIIINIKYKSEIKYILLFVEDGWDSVKSKILNAFGKKTKSIERLEYVVEKLQYEHMDKKCSVSESNCNAELSQNHDKIFDVNIYETFWGRFQNESNVGNGAYGTYGSSTVDKMDEGLAKYYKKLGISYYTNRYGIGLFRYFVYESGFDEDGIDDELNEKADDCTIIEFDCDDDGNNFFPLEPPIDDEEKRKFEIHRILNDIAKYGAPKEAVESMELSVEICNDLEKHELDAFTSKYTAQMSFLDTMKGEDGNYVKWYLAVGKKQKYPFLTYMFDVFTREKAEHHWKCANDSDNMAAPLTVAVWAQKNKFVIALKRKYPQKANQLQSAMIKYSNRIMNRLQFQPVFKIKDNLKEIVQYVVSIPQFVKNLIDNKSCIAFPPFQVDLLIAVNEVQPQFAIQHDDRDDDLDDDENDMDPSIDHIGFVQEEFKKIPIYYAPTNDKFEIGNEEKKEKIESTTRVLGQRYNNFRTVLNGKDGTLQDDKKENNAPDKASKHFDPKTYPNRRRFSIFIDRRKEKPTRGISDEMTFFEPPNECNQMGNDYVPEIGFEFLRTCIIPRSSKPSVSATDGLCGQLMTFMFNVEKKDEIKCYIIWNGQTMRFHGDHIWKILPNLFVETDANKKFLESKEPKILEDMFEQHMDDRNFAKFYMALTNFES